MLYVNYNFGLILLFLIFLPMLHFSVPFCKLTFPTLSNSHSCPISINQMSSLLSIFVTFVSPGSHSRRYQCSSCCFFMWSPTLIPIVLIISQRFCKTHQSSSFTIVNKRKLKQLIITGPMVLGVVFVSFTFLPVWTEQESAN